MQLSAKGRSFIAAWEGLQTKMYLDSAGLPTIGAGHLLTRAELRSGKVTIRGHAIPWGMGLAEHECLVLLDDDARLAVAAVNRMVTVPLTQDGFDALVSFTFNSGSGALQSSTLLKRLNAGHLDKVPEQLRRWVHCAGKTVPGLVNRREAEVALWEGRL